MPNNKQAYKTVIVVNYRNMDLFLNWGKPLDVWEIPPRQVINNVTTTTIVIIIIIII